jgi:hypothetical protein
LRASDPQDTQPVHAAGRAAMRRATRPARKACNQRVACLACHGTEPRIVLSGTPCCQAGSGTETAAPEDRARAHTLKRKCSTSASCTT